KIIQEETGLPIEIAKSTILGRNKEGIPLYFVNKDDFTEKKYEEYMEKYTHLKSEVCPSYAHIKRVSPNKNPNNPISGATIVRKSQREFFGPDNDLIFMSHQKSITNTITKIFGNMGFKSNNRNKDMLMYRNIRRRCAPTKHKVSNISKNPSGKGTIKIGGIDSGKNLNLTDILFGDFFFTPSISLLNQIIESIKK
ncbi:MAG: hypothetical protein AAF433_06120, partial [Bacteroidota bacterium]